MSEEQEKNGTLVSLSEQYPEKHLKKTSYRNNFSAPFFTDDTSDSFDAEIARLRSFRDSFIVASTNCLPFTSINTAVQRGAALIAPYFFPQPEQYDGQHDQNFQKLLNRLKNAQVCEDEFGDVPQEVFTLIAMGSEFCRQDKGKDGKLTTGLPDIDALLTEEEQLYLEQIHYALETGEVDETYPYAHVILYHTYEDLLQIRDLMLSGDMQSPNIQDKGQMIANIIARYVEPPTYDMIEHEICTLLKSIETLKERKPYHYDHEIYELIKQDGFDPENLPASLTSLDITPSKENQDIVLSVLEALEGYPISRTQSAIELYKDKSLAPLVKFLEYYPNADPEIVSYALFEEFLPYGPYDAESDNHTQLIEDVNTVIEGIFDDDTLERFMAWKIASTEDGNDWDKFPDKKEQLQSFYACKDLISLYEASKHISLRYYLNLVIQDDIRTAEFLLENLSADHLINKDIADELITNMEQIGLDIEDAYTTPEPAFSPESDEGETPDAPQTPRTHLKLVTKDWTPDN
ncbi:MAG: hypothetical protein ACPG05_03450 [Bdellovibrionales bacterium]